MNTPLLQRALRFSNGTFALLFGLTVWGAFVAAAVPLAGRWREEARDRRVALAVEWNEYRDFNARLALPDVALLAELKDRGVTALVLSPITLNELIQERRVQPQGVAAGGDPLDAAALRVADPVLGRQIWNQLSWRDVRGVQIHPSGASVVVSRPRGGFSAMKDSDMGFDPALVKQVCAAGFIPIFRVFNDPWLAGNRFQDALKAIPSEFPAMGVLFSSDEVPGGLPRIPFWRSWLRHHAATQLLPEFRPAVSARLMARALPAHAIRTHSIPSAELKDLRPSQQLARWYRAVAERSCRFLLLRIESNDSRQDFLDSVSALRELLTRHGWQTGVPRPRFVWKDMTGLQRTLHPILAFVIVCLTPFVALGWACPPDVWRGRAAMPRWRTVFWKVVAASLIGALIAAAVAQTPFTRVQIVPFRGVKWAFIVSWISVVFLLYDRDDLRAMLSRHVRRWDLLLGTAGLAVVAYLILRTGNAPAGWRPSWEQSLRDLLESALVARPRFKEFAIGHPALWVGCYLLSVQGQRRIPREGRFLIAIGMIGPISMINTFCHLHSPLALELLRSFNGLLLGVGLGVFAVFLFRRFRIDPGVVLPVRVGTGAPILPKQDRPVQPAGVGTEEDS